MQSKRSSAFESVLSFAIGFVVAVLSQLVIFPWFQIDVVFTDNVLIALWFTVVSIIRSYYVRRWFNAKEAQNGCA